MSGAHGLTPTLQRLLRVLVIEDEPRYRAFLTEVLGDMDCQVTAVPTADEAYRFVESTAFDAVFLDLNLPIVDGTAFLEEFRRTHAETPVVIITGFADLKSA